MAVSPYSLFLKIRDIAADPADSPEDTLYKRVFISAIFLIMLATALWGLVFHAFQEPLAGDGSLAYCMFTLVSLLIIRRTRRIRLFVVIQMVAGMILPWLDHIILGGFAASSGVLLWSMVSPLAATLYYNFRAAWPWWLAYLGIVVSSGFLQPFLQPTNHLPPTLVTIFFVMNIGAVSTIVLATIDYFVRQKNLAYRLLSVEQQKSEQLLLNILPKEIAAILKNDNRTIADYYAGVSILFADLVGFTPLTAQMAPVEMVNLLNQIFSFFDGLAEKYDVEKIRTIGDNYMVAAGAPRPRADHALVLAKMALDMQKFIVSLPPVGDKPIKFRIGINSGSVVGGVIGRKKFVYDLWGDAVNIASRMESQGMPGNIQITESTYELIRAECICEPRGSIDVKGRGEMQTWFLTGLKNK